MPSFDDTFEAVRDGLAQHDAALGTAEIVNALVAFKARAFSPGEFRNAPWVRILSLRDVHKEWSERRKREFTVVDPNFPVPMSTFLIKERVFYRKGAFDYFERMNRLVYGATVRTPVIEVRRLNLLNEELKLQLYPTPQSRETDVNSSLDIDVFPRSDIIFSLETEQDLKDAATEYTLLNDNCVIDGAEWHDAVDEADVVLVATRNRCTVGLAALEKASNGTVYLAYLCANHAGKAIIGVIKSWAKEQGFTRLTLTSSEGAYGFYTKLGFVPTDRPRVEPGYLMLQL